MLGASVIGFIVWTIITNLIGERNEAAAKFINFGSIGLMVFIVFGFAIGGVIAQNFQ